MPALQEMIHRLEVGTWAPRVKLAATVLGLLSLAACYDLREFKNFASQEAMDTAQLARNLSEGKGYTTDFIRPISVRLQQKLRGAETLVLREPHPDLANPPVYPLVLSGLMKVLPFQYEIPRGTHFRHYQPEVLIAIFNQVLFGLAVFMVFRLARRLFDSSVAWVSALIFAGTNLFWQFSTSGLSTMFLVVLFLAIVRCLVAVEEHSRAETRGPAWFLGMAVLTGALVGIGALTRYSFGWLILPVTGFFLLFLGPRRATLTVAALSAFLVCLGPWLARNYSLSGTLFGTSGFAVYQGTDPFKGNRLERFLGADFESELGGAGFDQLVRKLLVNSSSIIEKDLPSLAGNWTSAFFLVGLLLPFRNAALNRIRVFVLLCFGVMVVAQALGKTYLSTEVPEVNSENLLVLLAPLVFIFGVGLYFILLDQIQLPFPQLRGVVTTVFVLLACAPLIFTLLPPKSHPWAYPPYWPPAVNLVAEWMDEDELMMSDVPWAVAWYGDRRCVWVTLDAPSESGGAVESDFFRIYDYQKPIQGLYLTTVTTDARFYSQIIKDKSYSWARFMLESLVKTNVPQGFPLKFAPRGFIQEGQLFLTDRERWNSPSQ